MGDVVLSPAGRAYRVQGFTLNNHLIVTEHGLDRTPAVVSMEIGTEGLTFPAVEYTVRHAAGLVEFA